MFNLSRSLSGEGTPMEPICGRLITFFVAMCFASAGFAQDKQPDQTATEGEAAEHANGPTRTGKERIGRKWMDEQRIDNCNVPIDKRGSRPRPRLCPHGRCVDRALTPRRAERNRTRDRCG